jgi:hypothetical protein
VENPVVACITVTESL